MLTTVFEIRKKIIEVIILVVSTIMGVLAIAWGVVIYNFICLFINLFPNTKLLNYSFKEQLQDFVPQLLTAISMGVCIFLTTYIPVDNIILLLIQFIVGILSYFLICKSSRMESFEYVYKSIRKQK